MQNLKHDVAVLQLNRPVQLSDKVTTVCLPDQDATLNSKCYITGLNSHYTCIIFNCPFSLLLLVVAAVAVAVAVAVVEVAVVVGSVQNLKKIGSKKK